MRKSKKYKHLIIDGDSKMKLMKNGLFKITRTNKDEKLLIVINITKQFKEFKVSDNLIRILST
jgi:proteasome assembly chaperone (PAC2) family protein